jgi:Protein of unknown function (DUF817)
MRGNTRFAEIRARLEAWEPSAGLPTYAYEFLLFGFKQGWACLFGALMLALLLGTHIFYPPQATLARYDFLTLAALTIQIAMLRFRLETWEEAKVILAFHIVGTVMELFKTSAGSWTYPEGSVLHIGAVPLFSGFMYACVGSYIARIWRIFDFRFDHFPSRRVLILLATAVYVNFFRIIGSRTFAGGCLRLLVSCFGERPSGSVLFASIGGCLCFSGFCLSRCSSGLPKTLARSRMLGFIPSKNMAGRWYHRANLARGTC